MEVDGERITYEEIKPKIGGDDHKLLGEGNERLGVWF